MYHFPAFFIIAFGYGNFLKDDHGLILFGLEEAGSFTGESWQRLAGHLGYKVISSFEPLSIQLT